MLQSALSSRVPCPWPSPPPPGRAPPPPACSLSSPGRLFHPSPGKGEDGDGLRPSPGGGHIAILRGPDPLPYPPSFRGRELPLAKLRQGGVHEIKAASYRDYP